MEPALERGPSTRDLGDLVWEVQCLYAKKLQPAKCREQLALDEDEPFRMRFSGDEPDTEEAWRVYFGILCSEWPFLADLSVCLGDGGSLR